MTDVTPEDMATEKALAALDMLADQWAERVDLLRIVGAVVNDPGKVEAMLRQSYEEGAYDGHTAAVAAAKAQIVAWLRAEAPGYEAVKLNEWAYAYRRAAAAIECGEPERWAAERGEQNHG